MSTQRPASSRKPVIAAAAIIAVLVLAAGGVWYLFLRPSGPAPVSLGATPAPAATEAAGGAGASPEAAASAGPGTGSGPASGEGLDGPWTVDPSVGSFSDFSGSFVGYRVQETLANVGATEAVGRTPDVTGGITIDGTSITAADFTADLTTLQSDNNMRDGQLRRQALQTGQFPTASFTLTAPIELGSVPDEGATVEVTATGDLTLHGVTKSVEIPLQARLAGDVITIAGSLPIVFSDFGMNKPQAMIVLSVEDRGTMELQLQLTRGGG
jgi:polyisoprenoid-binding protein YceI